MTCWGEASTGEGSGSRNPGKTPSRFRVEASSFDGFGGSGIGFVGKIPGLGFSGLGVKLPE